MSLATPSSVHVHTPVRPFTLRRAGHREQGGSARLLMRWVSKTWAEKSVAGTRRQRHHRLCTFTLRFDRSHSGRDRSHTNGRFTGSRAGLPSFGRRVRGGLRRREAVGKIVAGTCPHSARAAVRSSLVRVTPVDAHDRSQKCKSTTDPPPGFRESAEGVEDLSGAEKIPSGTRSSTTNHRESLLSTESKILWTKPKRCPRRLEGMDAQAKPAAERRQAELVATARRSSFGQDTSQLYERDDGKKPWRAEYPATVEEKQAGSKARCASSVPPAHEFSTLSVGEAR